MADISTELARILSAIYGEDVRGSIHDAIEKINDVSEVVLTTGTAVTSPSSSSTGFYDDSLYLNTDTFELWKCTGVNTWVSQGSLKGEAGDDGNGIVSIIKTSTSGLVDTYTITYTDGTTSAFTVTNGEDGANGNKWYRGTGISGKAALPTVYTTSGVADANSGDMFLNPSEGAVYSCVTGGVPTVATWQYEMTLSGGGGVTSNYADLTNKPLINGTELNGNLTAAQLGFATVASTGTYADLTGKPSINGHTLLGNQTGADLGLASSSDIPTVDQTYNATSTNAQSGKAVAEVVEQIYADNGVLGAKNLLPNNLTNGISDGVTFTVNADLSVTLNGTSTADIYLPLYGSFSVRNNNICKIGVPYHVSMKSSKNAGYHALVQTFVNGSAGTTYVNSGTEGNFTIASPSEDGIRVILVIEKGTTFNNDVIYPMLRLASDPDDTYVPYAMTNRELTEAIANIVTDDWTTTSQVQSDGTVTFTGLNDSYAYSRPYYDLPSGDSAYTYSKVTKSGSGTSVTLTYTTDAPSGTVCKLRILK